MDDHFVGLEKDDSLATMDTFYQRAYGLLSSPKAREAFSLKGETDKTKELYGLIGLTGPLAFRNRSAVRFLIARRLIEAGARFVTLTFGAWDTHAFHYAGIQIQMPLLDIAFSGLITDLDRRGLLDSTLVVVNSEFGRTPKVYAGGGRDHWPRVFSIVLAGGGIKPGQVYGASDALAAEPSKTPLSVFTQHCIGCHNADRPRGGLDLSTMAAVQEGGTSGKAAVAGKPDESLLYLLPAHLDEPKMPRARQKSRSGTLR